MPHTQGDAERPARTDAPHPTQVMTASGDPAPFVGPASPEDAGTAARRSPSATIPASDRPSWETTPVAARLAWGAVTVVLALAALAWAGFASLSTGGYPNLADLGGYPEGLERLVGFVVPAAVLSLLIGLGFLAHGLFVLGRRSDAAVGAYVGGEPWWEGHPTAGESAAAPADVAAPTGTPGAGSPARH